MASRYDTISTSCDTDYGQQRQGCKPPQKRAMTWDQGPASLWVHICWEPDLQKWLRWPSGIFGNTWKYHEIPNDWHLVNWDKLRLSWRDLQYVPWNFCCWVSWPKSTIVREPCTSAQVESAGSILNLHFVIANEEVLCLSWSISVLKQPAYWGGTIIPSRPGLAPAVGFSLICTGALELISTANDVTNGMEDHGSIRAWRIDSVSFIWWTFDEDLEDPESPGVQIFCETMWNHGKT